VQDPDQPVRQRPDGKRVRKWHSGYRTKRDAERARVELLARVDQGGYVEPSRLTLGRFLRDQWLPSMAGRVRPTTMSGYRTNLERYVMPRLGGVLMQRLTPAHLNTLYGELEATGGRGGRPLSARTVQSMHMTLRKALGDAARWGVVPRNVATLADPPTPRRAELATWSAGDLKAFSTTSRASASRRCGTWPPAPGCAAARSSACAGLTSTSTGPGWRYAAPWCWLAAEW
jgi:hypothetical protein